MVYTFLHWATLALSIFNTVVLLWLGATVLLNADRRTWGIWLVGGGILLGGFFFVSHTVILDLDWKVLEPALRFWWYAGLIPAVTLPLGWYLAMLWYAGFWDGRDSALYRRQRFFLLVVLVIALAGAVAVLIYANPSPRLVSTLPLRFLIHGIGGMPLLVAGYALFLLLCSVLTLDALLRPGPSKREMGDLARQRARPWLVAASLLLLLVSLGVIVVLLWVLFNMRQGAVYVINEAYIITLERFDLLLSFLVSSAVVVVGQAVVTYEIFTGQSLPRRGLRRQWQQVLVLAAGYSLLMGLALAAQFRPVYLILLATGLTAAFLALLSWRTFAMREQYIAHLRPFVASQHLSDYLLLPVTPGITPAPQNPAESPTAEVPVSEEWLDALHLFKVLCRDVLGAGRGLLIPLGPVAPLAGPPLAYPAGKVTIPPTLDPILAQCTTPLKVGIPLDPAMANGAAWAIPLWNERGLIGLLLLDEKEDGSLYTQEEMEIARASGERLIDAQAGAEMARRLLKLQRRQLAESQVADRQARRILHDDVLPQLHAALLALESNTAGSTEEAKDLLSDVHRQISDLLRDLPATISPAIARLGFMGALKRLVAGDLHTHFDEIAWEITPGATELIAQVPPVTSEVLFYAVREAIRNAARHGRNPASPHPFRLDIHLCAEHGVAITVEDNGIGLAESNKAGQANGRGLALHSTMMAVVGGALTTESVAGEFTRVRVFLPEESLSIRPD